MDGQNSSKSLDLNELFQEFVQWKQSYLEQINENDHLKDHIKTLQNQLDFSCHQQKDLKEEICELKSIIEKYQEVMLKIVRDEEELRNLLLKMHNMEEKAVKNEEEHKNKINYLEKQLEEAKMHHKTQLAITQAEMNQKAKQKERYLLEELERKGAEIQTLHKKYEDITRKKDDEFLQFKFQNEEKIIYLESQLKQIQRTNQETLSSISRDVFRKRLFAMREEHNREIDNLKQTIKEMQKSQSSFTPLFKKKKVPLPIDF